MTVMMALWVHGSSLHGANLQQRLNSAVDATVAEFSSHVLQTNELAASIRFWREGQAVELAQYRGTEPIYPASVVKLFYLAAAHRWMEDGKLADTPELRRAMRDMIVESYNDATHYILDAITGTTSGPELPPSEMKAWVQRRNAVNRYYAGLGYTHINVNQKPWCEGPYGRDRLFVGEKYDNRNVLTTESVARLLKDMAQGKSVTAQRSQEMMKLLERDYTAPITDPEDQAHGFSALALKPGAKLWSKAGWTSSTRHDAAYIEWPDGRRAVLVVFTTNHANERMIIPSLLKRVIGE